MPRKGPDWLQLDPLIARLRENGFTDTQIAKELRIPRQTLVDHLRSHEPVHQSTPERTAMTEVHQSAPEHQGTLEGYEEVITEVRDTVPEMRDLVTEEEHPSTPEVHPEVSLDDSSMAHSGVPALRDEPISTLPVHPGTPTAEDWKLWTTIKARWLEVEKMLADRQALLSTLRGTPGHTQKKTYVFDVRHIALIEQYADAHRLELKDVIYAMCEEFFQRR